MVSLRYLLLAFFVLVPPLGLFATSAKVSAEMDSARTGEYRRLEGKVSVFHAPGAKINVKSFEMEKKPFEVEFVQERKPTADEIRLDHSIDPDTMVSVYRFQLPGKAKGLYILPAISVVVDGQRARSVPATYEVTIAQASKALEIEAFVEGEQPFYPGQHAVFTYRIYYNRNIELTEEHLPLLEAEGFQKVGNKEIKDSQSGNYTIQEIRQEVRAIRPGAWSFGPSYMEGVAYEEDSRGQRKYDKQRLKAIAPAINVEVAAFPEKDKPASFTGAVGDYAIKTRLLTPAQLDMGEKLEVGVRVTGGKDPEDLIMPDVSCQPGFAGFFHIGDYPPFEQRDVASKEFILNLRPLSAKITEVPPIEFAYFDPQSRQYKVLHTDPLPITVKPLVSMKPEMRSGKPEEQVQKYGPKEDQSPGLIQNRSQVTGVDWRIWLGKPSEVKIASVYRLTDKDLVTSPWTMNYVWVALCTVATLFLLQAAALQWYGRRPVAPKVMRSEDYLSLAAQCKHDPAKMASWIEEAFLLLMVEKGWYVKKPATPEELSHDGLIGQVRDFLIDMSSKRYSGVDVFVPRDVLKSAKQLYRTVRYGRG